MQSWQADNNYQQQPSYFTQSNYRQPQTQTQSQPQPIIEYSQNYMQTVPYMNTPPSPLLQPPTYSLHNNQPQQPPSSLPLLAPALASHTLAPPALAPHALAPPAPAPLPPPLTTSSVLSPLQQLAAILQLAQQQAAALQRQQQQQQQLQYQQQQNTNNYSYITNSFKSPPSVSQSSTAIVKEVCRDFLAGKCHRGQNCRFLHTLTNTTNTKTNENGIYTRETCSDYIRGRYVD